MCKLEGWEWEQNVSVVIMLTPLSDMGLVSVDNKGIVLEWEWGWGH